jgi:hypothetical protein
MGNVNEEVLKTLRSRNLGSINMGKKRTHMFNVDFTDINPNFTGKFTVHHPSQLEKLQIGITKSALLGGNFAVDTSTDNIAHIVATLDVVLDAKPDWFDIDDPEVDYDILEQIYMEYLDWVNAFRKKPIGDTHTGNSEDHRVEVSMANTEDVQDTANGQ